MQEVDQLAQLGECRVGKEVKEELTSFERFLRRPRRCDQHTVSWGVKVKVQVERSTMNKYFLFVFKPCQSIASLFISNTNWFHTKQ